jgi:hypothetical protein
MMEHLSLDFYWMLALTLIASITVVFDRKIGHRGWNSKSFYKPIESSR